MSMSVIGKHKIAVETAAVADGDSIAAYLADASGNFINSQSISGSRWIQATLSTEYAEDAAHTSGDRGQFALAVRHDADTSMVSADGDYAPLQVDANGKLKVSATVDFAGDYAEDSAHSSGDVGLFQLAVRRDARTSGTSADGDYASFNVNANGELWVYDKDSYDQLVLANASLDAIEADADEMNTSLNNIEGYVNDLRKAEDAAHASGDYGIQALAVRQDTLANSTSADGDYASFKLNQKGELYVINTDGNASLVSIDTSLNNIEADADSINSLITALSKAEDSAHVSGDQGIQALLVRSDADASLVSATGDYAPGQVDALGRVKVLQRANVSNLQQVVSVTTTATALPTSPLANRQSMMVQNQGNSSIYVGSATVTSAGATKGIEVPKGGSLMVDAGPSNAVYAIAASGSISAAVWELS